MKRTIIAMSLLLALTTAGFFVRAAMHRKGNPNAFHISYLESNYEVGPEEVDLDIPRDEDKALLDETLETILDGEQALSDEDKCIHILKYVASVIVHKPNDGSATKIIREGFAICGGKSQVFVTLCRRAGLAARYVGSMYMPELRSHAISEVSYEGRWHLYDPTFGIFFYSSPDYDRKGRVISFHDLVSDPYKWTTFKVVLKWGEGRYDERIKAYPVTKIESEDLEGHDGDVSIDSYRRDLAEAYPIAYGSDDMVSYPIDANLTQTNGQWYGNVDDADRDLASYTVRFSGSHYVGNGVPPAFHTWLIKASPPSTINIEYYSVNANPPKLDVVPLRAAKVIDTKYEDE